MNRRVHLTTHISCPLAIFLFFFPVTMQPTTAVCRDIRRTHERVGVRASHGREIEAGRVMGKKEEREAAPKQRLGHHQRKKSQQSNKPRIKKCRRWVFLWGKRFRAREREEESHQNFKSISYPVPNVSFPGGLACLLQSYSIGRKSSKAQIRGGKKDRREKENGKEK